MIVRPATSADLLMLGKMGAGMVRFHNELDNRRFIKAEHAEEGYAWWLGKEIENPEALVLVAERDEKVIGYTYATIEETNWSILLGPHAGFHDIWVEPDTRQKGVGKALVEATLQRLREMGAKQIVLMSGTENKAAQKLAASYGFRKTMVEMTLEL